MQSSRQGFARREIIAIVALLLGMVVAAVYAAQRKVRQANEDTTVLCNIRQLSAAADQYFLENGVSSLRLNDIVGADKYLKALATVAGETYPPVYVRGLTITVTGIGGTRTVTYAP